MPKKKPGLRMKETLWGFVAPGIDDFEEGYRKGKELNYRLQFWVTINIDELEEFIRISGHTAPLAGTVSCPFFGKNLPIRNGEFNLFQPDAGTGDRRITYSFGFTGRDGVDYYVDGFKVIFHDPGKIDLLEDMTTLFTRVYRSEPGGGQLVATGILHYHVTDAPAMLASMEVTNATGLMDHIRVRTQYFSFVYGELRDTYLDSLTPFYSTAYENIVLRGVFLDGNQRWPFFLFCGIHDKDFPWGDGDTMWDIGLIVEAKEGIRRYALSRRIIEGLTLNIKKGILRYSGPVYEITTGYQVRTSQMAKAEPPAHLARAEADITLSFEAEPFPRQNVPFSLLPGYDRIVERKFLGEVKNWLPHFDTLGLHLTPHKVTAVEGSITLRTGPETRLYAVDTTSAFGEAEVSTLQNVRKPTMYYNYFCALDPSGESIRLHVRSGVLREDRRDLIVDTIEEQIGRIIDLTTWLDVEIKGNRFWILPREEGDRFQLPERVLLEINNDHYPTAVFQRRIVEVKDEMGRVFRALEENMDALNLGSIKSDRVAVVAAIRDTNKHAALDRVIAVTGFLETLDAAWRGSGKSKDQFSVIIKPNFMFMYSLKDRTTFTDPELVEHLVAVVYAQGFRTIKVADARSTYGTFFTNREVEAVARYIGLDGIGPGGEPYGIVDLSTDLEPHTYPGKLGDHFVNREWKDADFRVSFAKNKTHSYAYYTLTLKNIYGALPMENKFKEYHVERDIFSTTIEYLKAFPVHFGFIDGAVSADGPFGIFADKDPNYTDTIIGGDDLVAVDWIGAGKMGLDPMVSPYMKLAVDVFGKPEINLIGDRTLYPGWVNVPDFVSTLAFGLDANYYFGNLFYAVFATMDPYFEYKEESVMRRIIRVLDDPIRSLFFERVRQGLFDAELTKRVYRMFSGGTPA